MNFVFDERVDALIACLRKRSADVISISEKYFGIADSEVLKIANNKKLLIVTEDKDFRELTYRLRLEHNGILLIRLRDVSRNERIKLACDTIEVYCEKLKDNFSVLSKSGLRIKPHY